MNATSLAHMYRGNLEWLPSSTIYLTRHGSHAYGTNVATSDQDFKGFCIAPRRYYYGFLDRFEQAESTDPDLVIYDLRKFFKLAADCNPNIIEVLFTDPGDILIMDTLGLAVRGIRDRFLSRKAKHTFSGYAAAQLQKIKRHHAPGVPREGRNPVRAELEARFGYDTKHALHLVRLLRMAREILTTGEVIVKRPDAAELIAIRNGEWPYEDLIKWAASEDAALVELEARSPLPREPNRKGLNVFCDALIAQHVDGQFVYTGGW